jgi:magnesium transporter
MIRTLTYHMDEGVKEFSGIISFGDLIEDANQNFWVDIEAPTDEEAYVLTSDFKFHPLVIEDVIVEKGLPKLDVFDKYLFLVFLSTYYKSEGELGTKEIDLFFGRNFVVSIHNDRFPILDKIRQRCLRDERVLSRGSDFTFHTILDYVVDEFVNVRISVQRFIDKLEEEVFSGQAEPTVLKRIFELKEDIGALTRLASSQRQILWRFSRGEYKLVGRDSIVYYRDVYDHLNSIVEHSQNFNDILSNILSVYLSMASNKTNEIMKTLTIFTVILLPLSVISGIYGMNLDFPEKSIPGSYFMVLGLMAIIVAGLLLFFKKKDWL